MELAGLDRDNGLLAPAANTPDPRITYDEAVDYRHANGHADFVRGDDFGAPHETAIGARYDRPVMVYNWPAAIKAFYMKRDPEKDARALAVDVIAPQGYGEIIGGSERASDLAFLEQQIEKHDLPREHFEWYLDLRRYGSVPHSGYGLGLERTVGWICGVEHVRETSPFPRMMTRIEP